LHHLFFLVTGMPQTKKKKKKYSGGWSFALVVGCRGISQGD
jgi:hypothetical protein